MSQHLIYAVLALQVLDVASTLYAFKNGAVEANPVMRKLMDTFGVEVGLILPKLFFAGAVWIWQDYFADWALVVVCIGYAAVVANNVRIGRKG